MRFFAILVVLIALAVPAYAGDVPVDAEPAVRAPERLDALVVTATRTGRTTEEVPAAVTAVTKEEIKDNRMFGVSEALTGIAGVQSETKNGGYDSRLIIRGAGLKARYGVREIMILLDGVPITDPDGMSRLDFVDTSQVESIDVVKGPNSTMYGANAAGGVINIMTKSPFEETKSAKAAYGSENTQIYNLNYGNRIGGTYISASGSRRSTDSWREWNRFSTNQGSLKVGRMFDDGTTLEAAASYTRAYFQLPGSLTKQQFDDDISQRTEEPWRHSVRNSEIVHASVRLDTELGRVRLKPMAYFESWSHYHPVTGIINDGEANVYGADVQADVSHRLLGGDATFSVGGAAQVDDSEGEKFAYKDYVTGFGGRIKYTTSNVKGTLAEKDKDTTAKWGVFVQESVRPTDRLILDAGVRYDQVRFDIDDQIFQEFNYATGKYAAKLATVKRGKTYDNVSPRLGVVYRLADFLHMYGNISTGFQTPQSSELSLNPDLKPMTVINYETGLKARSGSGHSADLSVFYMTNSDEVVQTVEAGGQSTYSNAGKTDKFGVEFSGSATVASGLVLGGAYTYSDFKYRKFEEPVRVGVITVLMDRAGNRLPYVPPHQYSAYVNYRHPSGFKCRVDSYTWGRYFVDNANTEKYRGYCLLTNALVGYERAGFDLTFSVNNIFDRRYAMEVTKDTAGKVLYKPGAPMTWMLMATYNFPAR
ncbi:MAG: TonB-dependent receptor [Nitrospirae bacterium]|nr:TonB-dependent receptor [Nitrospirota bacterium]